MSYWAESGHGPTNQRGCASSADFSLAQLRSGRPFPGSKAQSSGSSWPVQPWRRARRLDG
jgi:hypothetical protein